MRILYFIPPPFKPKKRLLNTYDLYNYYTYNHANFHIVKEHLYEYIPHFCELHHRDYYEWLSRSKVEHFSLMHLDISNDGKTIENTVEALEDKIRDGLVILFEGGSEERDNVVWMKDYNKKPINSIKDKIKYTVLDERFPSISRINKDSI